MSLVKRMLLQRKTTEEAIEVNKHAQLLSGTVKLLIVGILFYVIIFMK